MAPIMDRIDLSGLRLSHSPMINAMHKYDGRLNPHLMEILDPVDGNNMTEVFFKDLEWRSKKEHNVVIEIKGVRGSGKSYLARGIKGFMDSTRKIKGNIKDIVFTRQEFIDGYSTAKLGTTFIIDEDFGFQTQTGSMRIRESLLLAEQAFRIEEISTIACSVAPTYSHLYDYYLLAYDYNVDLGLNRAIVFNTSQLGIGLARPAGFILFPTRGFLDKQIEPQYIKKKKDFTAMVKAGKVRTLQEDYDTIAGKCIKKFGWESIKPTERVVRVYLKREYPYMANTEQTELLDTIMVRMFEIHGSSRGKKKDEREKMAMP